MAAPAPQPGLRTRPEPRRRRRVRPGDPPLVRAVGPVPHRRRRAEHLRTTPGGRRDRGPRPRRPAQRRPRRRRPTRAGRLRWCPRDRRPVAGPPGRRGPGPGAHGMRTPRTDRGRLLLVLALAAVVTVFTATVPLLRDWFDLRVYYGPSTPGSTTAAGSTTTTCPARPTASRIRRSPPSAWPRWATSASASRSSPHCSSTSWLSAWCCASWPGPDGGATAGSDGPSWRADWPCSSRCATPSASGRSTSCCWPSS